MAEHVQQADATEQGVNRFPCGKCGAMLHFEPGTEGLECSYCGFDNGIERETVAIRELDFRQMLNDLGNQAETIETLTVKCDACAAEIEQPKNMTAFACPYCDSNIVTKAKKSRLIKPKSLLPFHVTREESTASFAKWLRSRWFAPNDLKKYARTEEKLQGIYIPYWTYDCDTTSDYTGQRGEDYWVSVGSGKNKRMERRTNWYFASGTVSNRFDDVLVLASKSIPSEYTYELEPWDLQNLVPYKNEYLAGFKAERYQVQLDDGFETAGDLMEPTIRLTVKANIGGDRQRIHSLNVRHRNITFKHVLLPVWISAYRYRNKLYRILINARTGEVQGERPWSVWKILFATLMGTAAAIAAALFYGDIQG